MPAEGDIVGDGDKQWNNCESLVEQMDGIERIIANIKSYTTGVYKEKEPNPKHSDRLQHTLLDEHPPEMKTTQMEVMRLRQKLLEECEKSQELQNKNEKLSSALERATARQFEEQLSREKSSRASLEDSHAVMVRRVQDLEKVVEANRKEVQVLQQENKTLRSEAHAFRECQQQDARIQQLEEECTLIKAELDARDALVTKLQEEGRNKTKKEITEASDGTEVELMQNQLKKALEEALSKTEELSDDNILLRKKVEEMEKTQISHKSRLKSQEVQLKHYRNRKAAESHDADKWKEMESNLKQKELLNEKYEKENREQSLKIQEYLTEMSTLEAEICEAAALIERQDSRLEAEKQYSQELERKCQVLADTVRKLKSYKEGTGSTLKEETAQQLLLQQSVQDNSQEEEEAGTKK
ncbi:coiled-coil domain-containing protein 150-like isoform X2 [Ambystoma mexicanum]|uniref:coiled-coil domain-containing protein 150-like isoform X2 n=1 Tax=Ambystoma mexicanum TaxID=8296 RepID=UPI0037E6FB36